MDSILDMMSEEEREECTHQESVEDSFSDRVKHIYGGSKIMKDVQIIVENELAERFGVEITNVSPTIDGAVFKIYGRIHLKEPFNLKKQVLVIKGELLANDFIVHFMTDSMSTLVSEIDDFCLYTHMFSLEDEEILSINKIRIFPAIYQSDSDEEC